MNDGTNDFSVPETCVYCMEGPSPEHPLTDISEKLNGEMFACDRPECEKKVRDELASREAEKIDRAYDEYIDRKIHERMEGG